MANRVIDVGQRMQAAFGYVAEQQADKLYKAGFQDMLTGAEVFVKDTSMSFEAINLKWKKQEMKFGFEGFKKFGTTYFAPPPMCSYSRAKRIEATVLDGDASEAVEKYGYEPWRITIQGVMIDMENHNYPREKVVALNEFFEIDDMLAVEGQMFEDLKIRSIYFTNIQIANVQGFEDTVSFTLEASSIRPVEYFLKKNKK